MEININKKIASNTKNIEVTGDIIVPDTYYNLDWLDKK